MATLELSPAQACLSDDLVDLVGQGLPCRFDDADDSFVRASPDLPPLNDPIAKPTMRKKRDDDFLAEIHRGFDRPGFARRQIVLARAILLDAKTHDARAIAVAHWQLHDHRLQCCVLRMRRACLQRCHACQCAVGLACELVDLLRRCVCNRECRGRGRKGSQRSVGERHR